MDTLGFTVFLGHATMPVHTFSNEYINERKIGRGFSTVLTLMHCWCRFKLVKLL